MFIGDTYEEYDNQAFFYNKKIEQLNSNSFQIDYSFQIKSNYIKADEYKEVCEQINTIVESLPIVIYFQK